MFNSAMFLKGHALSNGKLGATGFCWGGGMVNQLAVRMGADLQAGAPFYGSAPALEGVGAIRAALQIHYAANDERINSMRPAYEAALDAAGVRHEAHLYEGTSHGFHNNSTPRYDEAAAALAWERMVGFFRLHLA
jgi:carboxymethylenebutenolidase